MTTGDKAELLPCRWCNGTDLGFVWSQDKRVPLSTQRCHVFCRTCKAQGPGVQPQTEENAISAWNTRASSPPASAEVAALANRLENIGLRTKGKTLAVPVSLALDIIQALRGQASGAAVQVPEGWKLVPIEPTSAMICAGETQRTPRRAYEAMLSAAPKLGETA